MDILAKITAENIAEEEKTKAPTNEEVAREAVYLKRWAKGKPIRRQTEGSTFWAAGKWMTKLTFKMAQALADAGLAELTGDPRKGGSTLRMKP